VRIVAGLGNPGPAYERTRHNVGFRVLDAVAGRLGVTSWRNKHGAALAHVAQRDVVLVKPMTYMNESGEPLASVAGWYKVTPADTLVISDDLDLPFGRLRMRASGGSGGHNGLRSIIARFGENFPRLRIGIGRGASDTIDYVLSTFSADEERELPRLIGVAADGIERWLAGSAPGAIQMINAWRPEVPSEDPQRAS